MKEYLKNLIKQYQSANGVRNIDVNSQEFKNEFIEWIKDNKTIGKKYFSFLEYMEAHPTIGETSAEIGKCKYDSIALDSDITIISPYFDKGETANHVIPATFGILDGMPTVAKYENDKAHVEAVDTSYFRRFITQNPYSQDNIKNWEYLHNKGENITVGVFGRIYDKDIDQKIKQIMLLKSKLTDDFYKEDHIEIDDMYCYAISSTRKVKVKTLSRHR